MYKYEIPVNQNAYSAREMYNADKKRMEEVQRVKREYTDFISNSRDYLVAESINMILQDSLNENTTSEDREYGKALVEGFVKENGSIKLLGEFSRKSLFLANIAEAVNDTHKKIVHSCKEGDSKTLKINKTIKDEFFDKLIGLNDKKITEKINERVCDSIQDFVQGHVNDQLDLEELAEKTQKRLSEIKATSVEQRKRIEEQVNMDYKREAQKIRSKANRKVGLYEQLKYATTEGIVKDSSILESFTTESGKLDMDKITRKVDVMYTFLETLNTTKIATVNESYIEKILKSI